MASSSGDGDCDGNSDGESRGDDITNKGSNNSSDKSPGNHIGGGEGWPSPGNGLAGEMLTSGLLVCLLRICFYGLDTKGGEIAAVDPTSWSSDLRVTRMSFKGSMAIQTEDSGDRKVWISCHAFED